MKPPYFLELWKTSLAPDGTLFSALEHQSNLAPWPLLAALPGGPLVVCLSTCLKAPRFRLHPKPFLAIPHHVLELVLLELVLYSEAAALTVIDTFPPPT